MEQFRSIIDCLNFQADDKPDKPVFRFVDREKNYLNKTDEHYVSPETLTYRELEQLARKIGGELLSRVQPGDRVLLLYPPGLDFMAAFFACMYTGVIAVPAVPPFNKPHMNHLAAIAEDCGSQYILSSSQYLERTQKLFAQDVRFNKFGFFSTDTDLNSPALDKAPLLRGGDLAFLQYTSGSTGQPKGVMVSHANIISNAKVIYQGLGHTPDTVSICWLPHFHDMGLIGGVLIPVYQGFTSIFMPPTFFLQKPMRWLQAIDKFGAESSGGPNFAYKLCVDSVKDEDLEKIDLSGWKVAFNGAEPIQSAVLDQFSNKFSQCGFNANVFYPCYGMAETTLMVCGGEALSKPSVQTVSTDALQNGIAQPVDASKKSQSIVSCGKPPINHQILVVDPESNKVLADNHIGEIWIQGGSVTQGYWNKEELTKATFGVYTEDDRGPFLKSGDLGFIHNREIYVCGRSKDLIIIRGRNLYPQDIELAIEKSTNLLLPNKTSAFSSVVEDEERLVLVAEVASTLSITKYGANKLFTDIQAALSENFELQAEDIVLIKPGRLPVTSSGKKQRRKIKLDYDDKIIDFITNLKAASEVTSSTSFNEELHTASSPDNKHSNFEKSLQDWLVNRIAHYSKQSPSNINLDQSFHHFGLDSLSGIKITGELGDKLDREISPTVFYDYPSIRKLCQYLTASKEKTEYQHSGEEPKHSDIAIIGVGLKFPGANTLEEYWDLLYNGKVAVRDWDKKRQKLHPTYPLPSGYLEGVDEFDAELFGITPKEAKVMDPQQRLLLEISFDALRHAGYAPADIEGTDTGVFIGISLNDYARLCESGSQLDNSFSSAGNSLSIAANRISYFYDLKGPSLAIDTACSSSLVALHEAINNIHSGNCDTAIVGGVNLILGANTSEALHKGGMLAHDGRCKVFDDSADGYARGEGCGVVIIKPLAKALKDRDQILAVIKATALEQDGRTNGLHAPNGLSQKAAIRKALYKAKLQPNNIQYVEAHGTGTRLGDPIEINALNDVYRNSRDAGPLYVGSVKANIGHLESAAGIASLIKSILVVNKGTVVPQPLLNNLNEFFEANTKLQFSKNPIVNGFGESEIRRVGVSSFGFGGTNAHVILEQAPDVNDIGPATLRQPFPPYDFKRKSYWIESNSEDTNTSLDVGSSNLVYRVQFEKLEDSQNDFSDYPKQLVVIVDECHVKTVEEKFNNTEQLKTTTICYVSPGQLEEYLESGKILNDGDITVVLLETLFCKDAFGSTSCALATAQTILKLKSKYHLSLWLMTLGASEQANQSNVEKGQFQVGQAALWGMAKSMSVEQPNLFAGIIDIDQLGSMDSAFCKACAVYSTSSRSDHLAEQYFQWYEGNLYGQRLVQDTLEGEGSSTLEGSALITGGLGGIGLQLAERLVHSGIREIHLCGRRKNIDPKYVNALDNLNSSDVNITYHSVDITDKNQLFNFTKTLKNQGTTIEFCFHAAGVLNDKLIGQAGIDELNQVLAPKIHGAFNLHEALSIFTLKSFVLFSSSSSVLGNYGQVAYSAANAALDSFANWRSKFSPTLSVSWGPWKNSVMAEEDILRSFANRGIHALESDKALTIMLGLMMQQKHSHVCVQNINWGVFRQYYEHKKPSALLSSMPNKIRKDKQQVLKSDLDNSKAGEANRNVNEWLRNAVATISEQNIDELDLNKSLVEIGFDSLLTLQLQNTIRSELNYDISIDSLLDSETLLDIKGLLDSVFESNMKSELSISYANKENEKEIQALEKNERAPLSFAQERLWFLDQYQNNVSTYHMPGLLHLNGKLNIEALDFSIKSILKRHEILRSRIQIDNEGPCQVVEQLAKTYIEFKIVPKDELELAISTELKRPFDLTIGPLFRVVLFEHSSVQHTLFINMHHIASDGLSISVFLKELKQFYGLFADGNYINIEPLKIQYRDYADWQKRTHTNESMEGELNYWRDTLKGLPSINLSPVSNRPKDLSYKGNTIRFQINKDITSILKQTSKDYDCTLFMILASALAGLIYRYTGQSDFAIGTPMSNRVRSETESIIGLFVNTLVLRLNFEERSKYADLLKIVKQSTLSAYKHQNIPFEKIIEALNLPRNEGHSPLFQVMLVLQDMPDSHFTMSGVNVIAEELHNNSAKYDLTLTFLERNGVLEGAVEYSTDLFDKTYINKLIKHFTAYLHCANLKPSSEINQVNYLSEADRKQIIKLGHSSVPTKSEYKSIYDRFDIVAKKYTDRIALEFSNNEITYGELHKKVSLAEKRLRQLNIDREDIVGIYIDRRPEFIFSILAVLKVGAAYLPLDVKNPDKRTNYIIDDARVKLVITEEAYQNKVFGNNVQNIQAGKLFSENEQDIQPGNTPSQIERSSEDLIYVIYTSGSTGDPKGVLVENKQVDRLFTTTRALFDFDEQDVWTLFHSPAFDFSVWEIFGALLHGGKLIIVPYDVSRSPQCFYKMLCQKKVTVLNQTPSAFKQLVDINATNTNQETSDKHTLALRYVIFGGEALNASMLSPWVENNGIDKPALINMYGITETTVHVTFHSITLENISNSRNIIGKPLPDLSVYLFDKYNNLVPIGMPGEITVGGDGVARGYWNREKLNSEKFIPDIINSTGSKLYKSGDWGRYLPDGTLEYLGRRDHQVKIRGFRIELGEIEAQINECSEVKTCVVLPRATESNNTRLVAYIVADKDVLDIENVHRQIVSTLPGHMHPSAFVMLDDLPLTINGKVDGKALEALDTKPLLTKQFEKPSNIIEEKLLSIFKQVLELDQISIRDSFFDLGGHSLLAINLMARISETFNRSLLLASLFTAPTIKKLAKLIEETPENVGTPLAKDILVSIASSSNQFKRPIFGVPGAGGQVLSFYPLASRIGDANDFYGLQSIGIDGVAQPLTSVESIAKANIDAIKTVQPSGPYRLLGHSFGGLVAFEMASILTKLGEEVEYLFLLDVFATFFSSEEKRNSLLQQLNQDNVSALYDLCELIGRFYNKKLIFDKEQLAAVDQKQRMAFIVNKFIESGIDISEQQFRGFYNVYNANFFASLNYQPKKIHSDIQAALFYSTELLQLMKESGWDELLTNPIKLIEVQGSHVSMLSEANADSLAKQMQSYMLALDSNKNSQTENIGKLESV